MLTLVLVACTNKKDILYNTSQVFRYNEHSNITSLDPAFSRVQANIWAVNQLFNGLVQLDDSLNIQPDIAKSWTISENALQYTFTLRNDVYFHKHQLFNPPLQTRTVTASDFEYSFNRLLDEKVASPGRWVLNYVDNYQAVNDTIFTVLLKQPFPAFLGLLSTKYCSVIPKEAIAFFGNDFRAHPIGTGPFQFKRWEENVKLVLRRNPLYFEKDTQGNQLPYLEAIAVTFLPDKQSEFLQFTQGNIDFLNALDASYKDELLTTSGKLQSKYQDAIQMISAPYLNTEYLGIYLDNDIPENQSLKLRKAINYGFDRQKMITYLRNNIGTPAEKGFIPNGLPGFGTSNGYSYQPEKAKQLITEFKKETGIASPTITISTDANYLDLCEYIQRELQKIGISTTIDLLTSPTLRQSKSTGKLAIFRASWIADYPDAENYLSLFYSKNFTPEGPNYTHFKNNLFDQWYEQAVKTTNTEERIALYQKMDSLIIEEAPVVPLYYDQSIRFIQKNIKGLTGNGINFLTLKKVKKID
ncbi:peptide ABC transporter substrate-binding protein [Neptunitalea chrysea]|uniref:Peptide ABC transporter substrate-binding protein n=1 Tax=Neptunitalea chrysea TaxID=1647581 RepID=A0A9W6B4C3_9FLAO|nr:peptide ABC transporter substrate-binding protein [Neptunitalea chrysea]